MSAKRLIELAKDLSDTVNGFTFAEPVTHVYNPLDYAWEAHRAYLHKFGTGKKRVVFMGMNPGPWGMSQTGVPFGEIPAVRDWMKINKPVGKPPNEHSKRIIEGMACERSEVSGRRLWGLFSEAYPDPKDFFKDHFILNFCPLVFMAETARNITPDKLPASESKPLFEACNAHLRSAIETLKPELLIGVGAFAEARFKSVMGDAIPIGRILHPSPASPAANRDWAGQVTRQLKELGVW